MEQKIMKYILTIAIAILCISVFTIVYSYTNKSEELDIYSKIDEEINYIEKQVLQMMKMLNNLDTENLERINVYINNEEQSKNEDSKSKENSFEKQEQKPENIEIVTKNKTSILLKDRNIIDWVTLQQQIESLSRSIAVITVDLTSVGINNNNIFALSDNINDSLLYVKEKNKKNSLISLAKIYNLLPEYKKEYSKNSIEIEMLYIKSDILSSYALLDTGNWNDIYNMLSDSEERMIALLNSQESLKDKSKTLDKTYVLLQEYIKVAKEKNLDLCYLKIYYLLEQLEQ